MRNASTNFNIFAGSCVPADFIFPIIAPNAVNFLDANVQLDVCAPSQVTVAVFSSANRAGGENANSNLLEWTDADSCLLPRLTTVTLTPGACVPVTFTVPGNVGRQYRAVLTEYWRLTGPVVCNAPTPAQFTLRAIHPNNALSPLPRCTTPPPSNDWSTGTYFNDIPIFAGAWSPSTGAYGFCNVRFLLVLREPPTRWQKV